MWFPFLEPSLVGCCFTWSMITLRKLPTESPFWSITYFTLLVPCKNVCIALESSIWSRSISSSSSFSSPIIKNLFSRWRMLLLVWILQAFFPQIQISHKDDCNNSWSLLCLSVIWRSLSIWGQRRETEMREWKRELASPAPRAARQCCSVLPYCCLHIGHFFQLSLLC